MDGICLAAKESGTEPYQFHCDKGKLTAIIISSPNTVNLKLLSSQSNEAACIPELRLYGKSLSGSPQQQLECLEALGEDGSSATTMPPCLLLTAEVSENMQAVRQTPLRSSIDSKLSQEAIKTIDLEKGEIYSDS